VEGLLGGVGALGQVGHRRGGGLRGSGGAVGGGRRGGSGVSGRGREFVAGADQRGNIGRSAAPASRNAPLCSLPSPWRAAVGQVRGAICQGWRGVSSAGQARLVAVTASAVFIDFFCGPARCAAPRLRAQV
jgi:hypothetical protein